MKIGPDQKGLESEQIIRNRVILYKRVFGTPEGKEILCELMNRFHILESHGGDAYREGQRSVVLEILRNTSIDVVILDKMLRGEMTNDAIDQ